MVTCVASAGRGGRGHTCHLMLQVAVGGRGRPPDLLHAVPRGRQGRAPAAQVPNHGAGCWPAGRLHWGRAGGRTEASAAACNLDMCLLSGSRYVAHGWRRALPQVFTSDIRGAGTDANVDISLYGTNATVTNVSGLDCNRDPAPQLFTAPNVPLYPSSDADLYSLTGPCWLAVEV